jgi:hypothetical protein
MFFLAAALLHFAASGQCRDIVHCLLRMFVLLFILFHEALYILARRVNDLFVHFFAFLSASVFLTGHLNISWPLSSLEKQLVEECFVMVWCQAW